MNVLTLPVQHERQIQRSMVMLKTTTCASACGHENRPEAVFCGECGASLSTQSSNCTACGQAIPMGLKFCRSCGTGQSAHHLSPESKIQCPESEKSPSFSSQHAALNTQSSVVVGREAELEHLHSSFAKALRGERQIVFITGEAGIGKTTLVDAFLAQIRSRADVRTTSGQCVEQYGPGEAYMPLLEATQRLCRGSGGKRYIAALQRYAPSWLVQLPSLLEPQEFDRLQQHVQGTSRERMLREMAEAVELFTTRRRLVVVLEDLHWSDVSTLDWLSYMAQRREPTKLLILATYRPTETSINNHPLRGVVQELLAHRQCEELRVTPLRETAIGDYLRGRFGELVLPEAANATLVQRTGGNPLFVVNMVDDFVRHGAVTEVDGRWIAQTEHVMKLAESVPDTLRQLIERQVEQLSKTEQRLLEVASVAGVEFASVEVAAGLHTTVEEVETICERFAHAGQWLRMVGFAEWPDGTLSGRYSFLHALYHEVIYTRVVEVRRIQLHRHIAARKEAAYGEHTREIAAELAVHFERGREYRKAVQYLQQAGENAMRRSAHHEAIALLAHGIELLNTFPDTLERARQELPLQVALGASLIAAKGYASVEVEHAYSRAYALCQRLEDPSQLFPTLWGLWAMYAVRAKNGMALALAKQLLDLASHQQEIGLRMDAHWAMGQSLLYAGELLPAKEQFEQGVTLQELQVRESHALLSSRAGQDAGVACLTFKFRCLLLLGYPDQACEGTYNTLALAQRLSHPFSECSTLGATALFHRLRREPRKTQEQADMLLAKATEQGFAFWVAWGTMLRGWALTEQGQPEDGLVQLQQGLATYRATGSQTGWALFLALFVEAHASMGRIEEAFAVLADAFASVEQQEEYLYVAELYRLKGELTLQSQASLGQVKTGQDKSEDTDPRSLTPDPQGEAEACFQQALEIARRQNAKLWELRAAVSLARMWQEQNKVGEARELLEEIYSWFTEGFDTKDLREAEALLVTLGGQMTTERKPNPESRVQSLESKHVQSPKPVLPAPVPQAQVSQVEGAKVQSQENQILNSGLRTLDARSSAPTLFRSEGEYWTVSFAGTTCRLKDARGLHYIAQLLHQPHQEIHVISLFTTSVDLSEGPSFRDPSLPFEHTEGDAGDMLDPQAHAAYKQRVRELQEELAEAQQFHDLGRSEQLAAELDFLTHELASAVGLGGRARRVGSPAERARVNITRAIKIALRKISEHHAALGQHLATTIKTGTYCSYTPDLRMPISWQQ